MRAVIQKSFLFTLSILILFYLVRILLKTDAYLTDIGGLGAFVTVFGTLYGIMAAFVVFEVWGQYNKTTSLIDQEALGLERLYRLTLYFRDKALSKTMRGAIENYTQIIIDDRFTHAGLGKHNEHASKTFRKIASIIKDIKFDDDHDQTIYDHIVEHYGNLSYTRTERITHCHMRLPFLLKFFLYVTSGVAVLTFVIMPFMNIYYGLFISGVIAFVVAMIIQLVEDLDNPFVGNWTITPEPYIRALKHIKEDY